MAKQNNLGLLFAAGAGIFLLSRTGKDGDGGGGGGGGGGGTDPVGEVTAGVSIQSIEVGGQSRFKAGNNIATLGAPIIKTPGENMTVTAKYTYSAIDTQGTRINWPFRVRLLVGHNTTFGWRTIGDSFPGGGESGVYDQASLYSAGSQGVVRTHIRSFVTPPDSGVTYDLRLEIFGAKSDEFGNPVQDPNDVGGYDWQRLVDKDSHPGVAEVVGAWRIENGATSFSVSSPTLTVAQGARMGNRRILSSYRRGGAQLRG